MTWILPGVLGPCCEINLDGKLNSDKPLHPIQSPKCWSDTSTTLSLMCPRCIIDALSKNIRHPSCHMCCCQILAKNSSISAFSGCSGLFHSSHYHHSFWTYLKFFSSHLLFQNLQYCYYPSASVLKKNKLKCSFSLCELDVIHRIKSIPGVKINTIWCSFN